MADTEDSAEEDTWSHSKYEPQKKSVKKTIHAPGIDEFEAELDADISENMDDDASDKTY